MYGYRIYGRRKKRHDQRTKMTDQDQEQYQVVK